MSSNNHVVIVNGRPRAGKDTAISMMKVALVAADAQTHEISSIDCVRELLAKAGFDMTKKTDKDRDLLAELGMAVEKHSDYRTNAVMKGLYNFFKTHFRLVEPGYVQHRVAFVHMREPELIAKLEAIVKKQGWRFVRVHVSAPDRELIVTSNAADRDAADMPFDYRINNDGDLVDLMQASGHLALKLIQD